MATHRPTQQRSWTFLAAAVLAGFALVATACGDDDTSSPSAEAAAAEVTAQAADDPESPYCRTALEWQVHELASFDDSDPAEFEAYFDDYTEFYETAAEQAPPAVEGDWQVALDGLNTLLLPVVERYEYDIARMEAEGTPEERALFEEPTPEIIAAQDAIHAYEATVCLAGQPPAAEGETFTGPADSAYCQAGAALAGVTGELYATDWDPSDVEAVFTGQEAQRLLTTLDEEAPEEIAADVLANSDHSRDELIPLLASYDFDVRALLLEASAEERAVFQYATPEIRDRSARVTAYDEQVCGAEG